MSIHPAAAAAAAAAAATASTDRKPRQNPNDVRVDPASSEVISSLLASLSSISLPSDSPSPLIPHTSPPTPKSPTFSRSSRPSVSQRPPSSRQQRDAHDPSIDFTQVSHPPAPEDFPIPPSSDAAEPPVIRTSRPPSGLSKLTAPKSSFRRPGTSQSATNYNPLSPFSSSPNSAHSSKVRLDGPLPPLPKISADRLKSRAGFSTSRKSSVADESSKPRGLGLQRDSLVLLRSREAKGKERARDVDTQAMAKSSASSLPPPVSRFRAWIPRSAQTTMGSRAPSATTTRGPSPTRQFATIHQTAGDEDDDDNDDAAAPGPSIPLRPRGSTDDFVVLRQAPADSRPSISDNRNVVPSRSSSLRNRSVSPPPNLNKVPSRRSSRLSRHRNPETVLEETFPHDELMGAHDFPPPSPLTPLSPLSPMTMDEDNDVVRRIKQLRAAKEERERNQTHIPVSPTTPDPTRHPPANGVPVPPTSSSAIEQLNEAQRVQEQTVKAQDDYPVRKASLSPTAAAAPFVLAPPPIPGSLSFVHGSPSPPLSPALSRSSSKNKRLSNPDLAARTGSSHRRAGSNTQQPTPLYPPVIEERRASFDSVNEAVTEFLRSPRLSQKIVSPVDNRTISFSEVGDPDGFAVFCCIGMGLTRYVTAFYEELALSLKLRLITPERPGIGNSAPYPEPRAPLYWPDDVRAICKHLSIRDFSLIAHSTGAIYAMATALQMPSRVKGKIYLLAPWIPPSQMTSASRSKADNSRAGGLPRSQRILRLVPTSILKLSNSSYFAPTARPSSKSPGNKGRKSGDSAVTSPRPSTSSRAWYSSSQTPMPVPSSRVSMDRFGPSRPPLTPNLEDVEVPMDNNFAAAVLSAGARPSTPGRRPPLLDAASRQKRYDAVLTPRVWDLATKGGNPAVDLIVCLERNQPIGFRYADIPREVVIRHGSRDTRVPLENVKWLKNTMQKAELFVLEGEGHSLMGSAGVMAQVLSDVGKEWERGMEGALNDSSSYKSPVLKDSASFDD